MRTTLDIDQDVLSAVKQISKAQGLTVGEVLSQLARQTLATQHTVSSRNGIPLFANTHKKRNRVTMKLANEIRDDL